ncbi:hypothetical protein PF005_g5090 [Phytophthora fragariae]|uniref:RxLR effector protein n=1 Tax=Phytophthora fragariae TaxID=53985 RepID=A0A6A3Z052_9STRA|nr:hypothetical protein PF003_g40715 [Phytophthora fragariae]KAE8944521.1 hypothetical protein PF009_g5791 [Phytophthora fragariae]KAE9090231.1 hypothetical protein PF010_g18664 [Phytophthora fragariae]KAE9130136.1 hypothetical protein PF007_g4617 [Phytophthora fragariae]KAE9226476.1 hypothetical protein PF005_g5090 [Phytophthora fragariae]
MRSAVSFRRSCLLLITVSSFTVNLGSGKPQATPAGHANRSNDDSVTTLDTAERSRAPCSHGRGALSAPRAPRSLSVVPPPYSIHRPHLCTARHYRLPLRLLL